MDWNVPANHLGENSVRQHLIGQSLATNQSTVTLLIKGYWLTKPQKVLSCHSDFFNYTQTGSARLKVHDGEQ